MRLAKLLPWDVYTTIHRVALNTRGAHHAISRARQKSPKSVEAGCTSKVSRPWKILCLYCFSSSDFFFFFWLFPFCFLLCLFMSKCACVDFEKSHEDTYSKLVLSEVLFHWWVSWGCILHFTWLVELECTLLDKLIYNIYIFRGI